MSPRVRRTRRWRLPASTHVTAVPIPFWMATPATSAVLPEAQLQTLFPLENRRVQERPEDYKLKLAQAYQGDIAPLTNHILAVTGHSLIEAIHVKMPDTVRRRRRPTEAASLPPF